MNTKYSFKYFLNDYNFAGAIFDDGEFLMEAAFKVALADLSNKLEDPYKGEIKRTSPGDVLETEIAMCSLLEVTYSVYLIHIIL